MNRNAMVLLISFPDFFPRGSMETRAYRIRARPTPTRYLGIDHKTVRFDYQPAWNAKITKLRPPLQVAPPNFHLIIVKVQDVATAHMPEYKSNRWRTT